jgi:hypothetical protein
MNSMLTLTAKSVTAGTSYSLLEGFWLAKASKTQAHKHPHHDGAVRPSSGMVLLAKHTSPPVASLEGVGRGHCQRV